MGLEKKIIPLLKNKTSHIKSNTHLSLHVNTESDIWMFYKNIPTFRIG